MLGRISPRSLPALSAIATLDTESCEISPAALWLRSASLRTSAATTANPLPCAPARAASMAAFSASMLVCRAISSMMLIFPAMSLMAVTVAATALPPSCASSADFTAIFSVCMALSAFCLMLALICSMEEEACSAEEACEAAPFDIWPALSLISLLPPATLSAALLTSFTTPLSFCTMLERARIKPSSGERGFTLTIRLPPAISLDTSVISSSAPFTALRVSVILVKLSCASSV